MMILSEPMRAFAEVLPPGWDVRPFQEILSEPLRNGVYKSKEFHGSGIKIVNMGELFEHEYISSQNMRRIELTTEERSRSTLRDGDLLFARRSLVLEGAGKCSLVISPEEDVTFESSIIRARPIRELALSRFLYYLFASPLGRAIMASIATRTAVSGIRGSDLAQVALPLPPLPIQRRIAGILSAYDDLIENSLRRIKILEEMARRLYREWFVQFRFPGHEGCRFMDSPLGEIPEGWNGAIDNISTISREGINPSQFPNEEFEHFSIPAFDNEQSASVEEGRSILSNKYLIDDSCILLSKLNPRIPRVWLPSTSRERRAITSTEFLVLKPKPGFSREFIYTKCCSDNFAEQFSSLAIGTSTSHQRVKPESLMAMPTIVPDRATVERFTNLVSPLLHMGGQLRIKSKNLRRTRDLLLPRLLSGQIDVEALPEPVVDLP